VNRKNVSLFLSLVIVLALLSSGCAKSGSESSKQGETPPQVSTEPVTLKLAINQTWLGPDEFKQYFEDPVKRKYPHITLEMINLSNPETAIDKLVASGTIPDIVQSASTIIYTFTDTGMADNIEPLIKKHGFDLSKLNKMAVESVKTASNSDYLIGLPWTMHFNATYYNKDIFDKFGVPYPKDGFTWEDAREMAKKLTRYENGVQYRGLEPDVPSRMASVMSQGFVDIKTMKATLNTEGWKKTFEFIKSVYDIPGNGTYRWVPASNDQFMKEKVLAMLPSLNLLPNFKGVEGLNWDMAQYPQFKEFPNTGMMVDEWILHVTKQSKYKDQAFQVIATVLSEEVQTLMSRNARLPILTGQKIQEEFGKNLPYLNGKNLQAAFKTQPAKALPATKYSGIGQQLSQEAFTRVMKEGVDINTALSQADEKLNKQIEASK
jgi:multiple sugar transport system substrate-binding protein